MREAERTEQAAGSSAGLALPFPGTVLHAASHPAQQYWDLLANGSAVAF